MTVNLDYESWRCANDDKRFCPPEGCPKWYGCARDHGWTPGQPSPDACTGKRWPGGWREAHEDDQG